MESARAGMALGVFMRMKVLRFKKGSLESQLIFYIPILHRITEICVL